MERTTDGLTRFCLKQISPGDIRAASKSPGIVAVRSEGPRWGLQETSLGFPQADCSPSERPHPGMDLLPLLPPPVR